MGLLSAGWFCLLRLWHPQTTPAKKSAPALWPTTHAIPAQPASRGEACLARIPSTNTHRKSKNAIKGQESSRKFQTISRHVFQETSKRSPPNSYRLSPGHGIISSSVCGYVCVQPLVNRIYASTTTFVNTRTPTMGATIMENDRCMSFYY